MPFNSTTARAAGLKSAANRDPATASATAKIAAQARWAGHERKSAPTELPAGPERIYWIEQVAARYPDEIMGMSHKALIRRATLLARQAAAEAAVEADAHPRPTAQGPRDGFSILHAQRLARLEAGARDE